MDYFTTNDANYYFNIYFYLSAFLIIVNSYFYLEKLEEFVSFITNSIFCIAFTIFTTYRQAVFVDENNLVGNSLWLYFLVGEVIYIAVVIFIANMKNKKKSA